MQTVRVSQVTVPALSTTSHRLARKRAIKGPKEPCQSEILMDLSKNVLTLTNRRNMSIAKCYTVQHQLSDYIDDTLSARQKTAVEAHLRACLHCRNEVTALKKTRTLVGSFYVTPTASDAYHARFAARLQKQIEQAPPNGLHHRISAAVARFGWQLQTCLLGCLPSPKSLSGFPGIPSRVLPVYVLLLAMSALGVATLLLHEDAPLAPVARLEQQKTGRNSRMEKDAPPQLPVGEKRALSIGTYTARDTPTGNPNEPSVTPKPLGNRQLSAASVSTRKTRTQHAELRGETFLQQDALRQYQKLPARGMLLTDTAYGLLLVQGIFGTPEEGWKPYQPKRRGNPTGFARKLLDVPLETRTIREVYDAIKL